MASVEVFTTVALATKDISGIAGLASIVASASVVIGSDHAAAFVVDSAVRAAFVVDSAVPADSEAGAKSNNQTTTGQKPTAVV